MTLPSILVATALTLASTTVVGPYVERFFPGYLNGEYETSVSPYGAVCNETGKIEEVLAANYDERAVKSVALDENGSSLTLYVSGDKTTYTVLAVASAQPDVTCALEAGILLPGEGI